MFRIPTHWLAVPTAVAVSAALTLSAGPEPAGSDVREWVEGLDPHEDAVHREYDARLRVVKARIAYKDELVRRLAASDAALAAVTDEFLRLDRGTPGLGAIRNLLPGSTDEEKMARNVIQYAYPVCRSLPADRRAEVMARLAREFEGRFGRPLSDVD